MEARANIGQGDYHKSGHEVHANIAIHMDGIFAEYKSDYPAEFAGEGRGHYLETSVGFLRRGRIGRARKHGELGRMVGTFHRMSQAWA